MVDNKKQRKSARNFNMEKHVERHFEIEKEEIPALDTPTAKLEDTVGEDSAGGNAGTSNSRGKLIGIIVVVLAILAFVAYRGCGSNPDKESEPTTTMISDSTEKEEPDTTSNVKKSTISNDEQKQNNIGESSVNIPKTPDTSAEATEHTTSSVTPSNSSVEEKAMQVWDGVYGNGAERKSKLGSDYKAVQKRVNEMYRNGYRH